MQEFRDGSFGGIIPASTLIEQMAKAIPADLKAVHFGTVEELEKVRNPPPSASWDVILNASPAEYDRMRRQVDELTARVNELAMQRHTEGVRVYPVSALGKLEERKQATK